MEPWQDIPYINILAWSPIIPVFTVVGIERALSELGVVGGITKNASCSELGDENPSCSELRHLQLPGASTVLYVLGISGPSGSEL